MHKISVIIPAAGLGRRMKSHGPKMLVELSRSETVISRQIYLIRKVYPLADITVVVGYQADTAIKGVPSGVKIVENELYDSTNVLRSIGLGVRVANYPNILIIYGDLVFNEKAISQMAFRGSSVLIDSKGFIGEDEVGTTVIHGCVSMFSYGLKRKWGQIAYLTGKEYELFRKIMCHYDKRKWFGYEGMNEVIDRGGQFRAVEPYDLKIAEIDTNRDIERAVSVYEDTL